MCHKLSKEEPISIKTAKSSGEKHFGLGMDKVSVRSSGVWRVGSLQLL